MDDKSDGLNTLSPAEKKLVYLICKLYEEGKKPKNIELAEQLGIEEHTVKAQKTSIYRKLNITGEADDKERLLVERVKRVWKDSILEPEPSPETVSETENPQNTVSESGETTPPNNSGSSTQPPPTPRNTTLRPVIIGVLIALGLFGIVAFFSSRQQPQSPAAFTSTPANTSLSTIQPATATTEGQGGIPVVFTDTPTFTSIPFTETVVFTPTFTPSAALEGPTLFEDDFSSPDLEGWNHDNNAYVYDGQLRTDSVAVLSVGNFDWTNYQVSFTVYNPPCGANLNYVGVRAMDEANQVTYQYCAQGSFWGETVNGNFTKKEATQQNFSMDTIDIVIRVQGNGFTAMNYPTYTSDTFSSGKVIIRFYSPAIIDNFRVVQLP